MLRQLKQMVCINVLLGALYVLFSLGLWFNINSWFPMAASDWGPLIVKPAIIGLPDSASLPGLRDQ
jgi:hypothetical protein